MAGGGVLVALTGAPSSPEVLQRAGVLADSAGSALTGVYVHTPDEPAGQPTTLEQQRTALEALGGRYLEVSGEDVVDALIRVATSEGVDQIVVGASRRSRWQELRAGALVHELARRSPVDVHVVASSTAAARPRSPAVRSRRLAPLDRWRRIVGYVLAIALPPASAAVLLAAAGHVDLAAELVIMLLAVLCVAAIGGLGPGALAALWANAITNWYFIPPIDGLSISRAEDALALTAFMVVALVIGGAVSTAARRSAEAGRARADARALAKLAGTAAGTDDAVPELLEQLRVAFGASGATLRSRDSEGASVAVASAGSAAASTGDGASGDTAPGTLRLSVDDTSEVTLVGEQIRGLDPDVTAAFLDQLLLAVEHRRLRATEEESRRIADVNELRATLLAAVSHDLRTPLASMKAASSALVQVGDDLDAETRVELASTVDAGVDRLTALVTNLLGMSRIRAGAVELRMGPVHVEEVVHRAVIDVAHRGVHIEVLLDEDLPPVLADATLLGHVVANLLDNACKWSPTGGSVRVDAHLMPASGGPHDTLVLRIADDGPGIPAEDRRRVRQAFERVVADDSRADSVEVEGTGLGLSVATGFCALMGVALLLGETTAGRGTTASLFIPLDVAAGGGGR